MPRKREFSETCSAEGCERASVTRGMCHKHYVASRRAEGRYSYSGLPRHDENGQTKVRRLANLLSLCDGFLHTLNMLSDRIVRSSGRTRSPEAQRLYELASELRVRIARELPGTPEKPFRASDWLHSRRASENGRHVQKTGAS